jgi:ATP-dependent helicase/nuclease subunit A
LSSQLSLFSPAKTQREPRRNLVIEAGAGTGKTTAIVAEVLKLMLENPDLAPERIVLVTFTEKAAGEIADRIHTALEEIWSAAAMPPLSGNVTWPVASPNPLLVMPEEKRTEWRDACQKQLERIDSLRSQTIHSFCQSLLRQFPIEAGLDPQFKIVEGFERSLLYGQLYDTWIDRETRLHPTPAGIAEWEFLLRHTGYLFMIREAIFELVDRRDLLAESGYETGDIRDVEEDLLDALLTIRDGAIGRYVAVKRPRYATLDEWIDYLEPIASDIRARDLPRGRAKEEEAAALKVLRGGDKGDSMYDRLASHRAALALLSMARRFVAFLESEKKTLGVADFDDLLLRTLALLDDEAVLERVRRQIDYLFVDEFQDTDRTQARIIDRLARDRDGAYVAGKTIVVGDPKQSIYGFRRADPETYDAMTRQLIGGGAEHRIITDQYRSDPPLLDAVNAVFTCLFPEVAHDPNVFRPKYHALRAGRTSSAHEMDARITFLHAEHDDKSDQHFREAESIAAWIKAHRDGGDLDLQRFAILFRRLTKIDDYLDTFDRHDIDYVLPPTRLFLDRRAPVDLIAVLRAIAYPFDRGAEISAARTPYFALTDEEIALGVLVEKNPANDPRATVTPSVVEGPGREDGATSDHSERHLPPGSLDYVRDDGDGAGDDGSAWRAYREAIDIYRASSQQLTITQLIDRLLSTTQIESVYDSAADGLRAKRHLEHLRAIAFDYDRKIGGSVRQFVDEIARRRAEPDEVEPSLADDSRNAVRILTVHGAKGLEFETVILPDLVFPNKGPEIFLTEEPKALVMRGQHETLSARRLGDIGTERENAEMRRLFYVAVTRAKSDVVFACNTSSFRAQGFFSCLVETFGLAKESFARLWPLEGREVRNMNGVDIAFERMASRTAGARTRRRLVDAALEAELAASEIVPLSITAPAAIEKAEIPVRRDRSTGILLHRVLELWTPTIPLPVTGEAARRAGEGALFALVDAAGAELGASKEAIAQVKRRLRTLADSETFRRIANAETIGRELPLRFDEAGTLVERRIDRLIREETRDTVIDYKSGKPAEEHRLQVQRYCDAVARMTGRETRGLIWYIDEASDRAIEL